MRQTTHSVRTVLAGIALAGLAATAVAEPAPIQIRSGTQAGENGTEVQVAGQVRAPDQTTVTLTLTRIYPTLHGESQRLMQLRRARVEGGAFAIGFEPFATGLPWGQYRVEAKIDTSRQYPGITEQLPPDGFATGTAALEVPMNIALAADLRSLVTLMGHALQMNADMQREVTACQAVSAPAERARHWEAWLAPWQERLGTLQAEVGNVPSDDGVGAPYAQPALLLRGLIERLDYWRRKHWEDLSGQKDELLEQHPNWLGDPPAESAVQVQTEIARSLAFHAALKLDALLKDLDAAIARPDPAGRRAVVAGLQDIQTASALCRQGAFPDAALALVEPLNACCEQMAAGAADAALDAARAAELRRSVEGTLRQVRERLAQQPPAPPGQ